MTATEFLNSLTTVCTDGHSWPLPKIKRAVEIIADGLPDEVRATLAERRIVFTSTEFAAHLWPDKKPTFRSAFAGLCRMPEDLRERCGEYSWVVAASTTFEQRAMRLAVGVLVHELAHVYHEDGYRLECAATVAGGIRNFELVAVDREDRADRTATEWGFGRFIEAMYERCPRRTTGATII
jgi:hypothetical protein